MTRLASCIAVVAFAGSMCSKPLELAYCKIQCVSAKGGRQMSEAQVWLEWIVENYNTKASFIYFVHSHKGRSWHRRHALPSPSGRSRGFGNQRMVERWEHGWERPMLTWYASAVENMTLNHLIETYHMHRHRCCGESIVSASDLRRTPLSTYRLLLSRMKELPNEPWGWVCERLWPILFHLSLQ